MNRTFTTLTTLAAAAVAFAGAPTVAAQAVPTSGPNYEFILGETQTRAAPSTEAVHEFQLDAGRGMAATARSPIVSYEFILERPAPAHARVSTAPSYEFQLYRDSGSASPATQSVYASTAAWATSTE